MITIHFVSLFFHLVTMSPSRRMSEQVDDIARYVLRIPSVPNRL